MTTTAVEARRQKDGTQEPQRTMGDTLGKLFVDVGQVVIEIPQDLPHNATSFEGYYVPDDGYGWFQLLFLGMAYAYILFLASNMISDGICKLMPVQDVHKIAKLCFIWGPALTLQPSISRASI